MKNQELSDAQIANFHSDGFLVVDQAVAPELLARIRDDFDSWVDDSRSQSQPYGETINGKPRFDLEPGHSAQSPALRRVNAPVEVSNACLEAMRSSRIAGMVADLIGPDIKFHHSKINSKLPGSETKVKWHQDFPFTPHTNDDLVTALLMVDEVTEQNGPLEVVPGSHRKEIHSLWHDGKFTGAVADQVAEDCKQRAKICVGQAGSACLMHTRLLHGSRANMSNNPRTLLICVYSAVDAMPCAENPMPSMYEGTLVAGKNTGMVRCVDYQIAAPQRLESASFFDQQARPK